MRCERIQELILTDYMDGELNEKARREIDAHIGSCSACGEFKRVVIDKATAPFEAVHRPQAPSYIWERVRQRIAADAIPAKARRPAWLAPVAAFAAAAAIIIAMILARPAAQHYGVNEYLNEQISFMATLDAAEGNGTSYFDTDIKTGAESIL